ncbi:MAG: TM2 domain-containing protein [Euryarchaeota archaeon]|nr:TM2 domain-containing protein [Euryarchaeota archaeon]
MPQPSSAAPQQPPAPQSPPVSPAGVHPNQQYQQQSQNQQNPSAGSQNQFTNFYQQHGSRYLQNPSQKDVLVTYILWFFLGPLGVHRFYLNQVGMGVFYFLTFGGCGLLWLIDIALIPDLVNRANRVHIRN